MEAKGAVMCPNVIKFKRDWSTQEKARIEGICRHAVPHGDEGPLCRDVACCVYFLDGRISHVSCMTLFEAAVWEEILERGEE